MSMIIRQIHLILLLLVIASTHFILIDSIDLKPHVTLITPNLFRISTVSRQQLDVQSNPQYVALINKAHEREYKQLRQTYPKLVLQVRDARQPVTGQLFYEHVFDYFEPNQPSLLLPVNLDNVSLSEPSQPESYQHIDHPHYDERVQFLSPIPQVIVSIRPHQINAGFGGEGFELVSSAPIPLEKIASQDGLKNFAFIQTDKPIYKPDEKVRIRALIINELMRPIPSDDIKIQVRNPQNIIVEEKKFTSTIDSGANFASKITYGDNIKQEPLTANEKQSLHNRLYLDHEFEFPAEPMLGLWTAQLLHQDRSTNDTVTFDVKEYVLPTFKIDFLSPKYILPSTKEIDGSIIVKYHYGKPVKGKAFFKFGYKTLINPQIIYIGRSLIKTIEDDGVVTYKFSVEKIKQTQWYPGITGARFVVEASISEQSTGYHEVGMDTSCIFLSSPYKISVDNAIDDFKPGIKQKITAELLEVNTDRPAPANLKVFAQYSHPNGTVIISNSDNMAMTDLQGKVNFNIGPLNEDIQTLHVTLKWTNSTSKLSNNTNNLLTHEQTSVIHTLSKHSSNGGWILIMNKNTITMDVGQVFQSDIIMRNAVILPKKIFYIIVSRGQIIQLSTLDSNGFIRFTATEDMVPSIRLVLFGLSGANDELISDAMRISIKHNNDCGLKLSYVSSQSKDSPPPVDMLERKNYSTNANVTVKPNERGKVIIHGNIGDHVSLIGIDNGVNALRKNTNHLLMPKIIERIKPLDTGCGFGGGKDNLDVFSNAGLMVFSDIYQSKSGNIDGGLSNNNKFTSSNDIRDVIRETTNPYLGSVCQTMTHQIRYNEHYQRGYNKALIYYSRRLNPAAYHAAIAPSMTEVGQKSSFNLKNSHDLDHHKKQKTRHKRDVRSVLKLHSASDHDYRCCLLGTIYDVQKRSCTVRTRVVQKYMPSNSKCQQIYLDCCRRTSESYVQLMSSLVITGRNDHPDYSRVDESTSTGVILNLGELDAIESRTLVRHDFRETWLFELATITQSSKTTSLDVQLPHSITTWSLSAMSMNLNRPICILSEPIRIVSFQDLFLHVALPYKVVQGEQLDIVATVFNYGPQTRQVVVYTYGVEGVCSESDAGERSDRKSVTIQSHTSQSVLFPMIPLRVGKYPIKIVAVSHNSSDAIVKTLNVVARGSPVEDHLTFHLDPKNHQHRYKRAIEAGNLVDEIDAANGLQKSKVRLLPSRSSDFIVPQTQECIVSAIGDKIGPTAKTTLNDVEHLIRLPHGCGEQVMIYLGPTLYTTRYLQSIGKLSGDLRWKAMNYIKNGYKRALNFRKEDGSFSAFVKRDSSIWLTAFIAKMLCQAERTPFVSDQIHIDKHVIVSALKWLLKKQYPSTGMWVELNPVYHREMLGGVLKENTLTAFVVVTLNECSHHSHELISETQIGEKSTTGESAENDQQQGKEPSKLDEQQQQQTNGRNDYQVALNRAEEAIFINKFKAVKERNAYVLALCAYALSFNRPHDASAIINDLMVISNHNSARNWLNWRGDHMTETAGYALLALLELQPTLSSSSTARYRVGSAGSSSKMAIHSPNNDAQAIVNWLNSRRSFTGSFDSTQDTIVALEALSKFAQYQSNGPTNGQLSHSSQIDLMCNVTVNNRLKRSIELKKDNALVLQQFKLDSFNIDQNSSDTIEFYTSGDGVGLMSVKLKYNVLQTGNDLCRFEITSSVDEWKNPINKIERTNTDGMGQNGDEFFDSFDQNMLYELNVADQPASASDATGVAGSFDKPINKPVETTSAVGNVFKLPSRRVARRAILRPILDLVYNNSSATSNTTNQSLPSKPAAARINNSEDVDEESDWTYRLANSIGMSRWFRGTQAKTTTTTTTTTTVAPQSSGEASGDSKSSIAYSSEDHPTIKAKAGESHPIYANEVQILASSEQVATTNKSVVGGPFFSSVFHPNTVPNGVPINNLSDKLDSNNSNANPANKNNIAQQHQSSRNKLILLLKVCAQTFGGRQDSEMAVIEIGILSGFKANEADLQEIAANAPALKYELSPDKSLVIIYMEYIPAAGPYCMQFRLVRESAVTNLQSGHIRVYDYYQPAQSSCSNFYTPTRFADQLETNCNQMSGVCKCASQSMCPKTNRLLEVGEIFGVNIKRGRDKFQQLVCSEQYDFVTMARLINVSTLSSGQTYLLDVKPVHDLKGNISKIVQEQADYRRVVTSIPSSGGSDSSGLTSGPDHITLALDRTCVKEDTTLLHFAHSKQFNREGEYILIFGRLDHLEKRYASRPQLTNTNSVIKQQPSIDHNNQSSLEFSHRYPYKFIQIIDRDSIIFDIGFQTDSVKFKDNIKTLAEWLELIVRRDQWSCSDYKPAAANNTI